MNISSKVKGIINIQVFRKGVCRKDVTFENLILDTFFTRFANDNVLFSSTLGSSTCRVGTGATPPANTDTALVSLLTSRTSTAHNDTVGVYDATNNRIVAAAVRQFEFTSGAVVGNISEIGFDFTSGSGLNSRSLIKDSFGTPTPLTLTADDQLVVNYTFQLFIPLVDYTGVINISGSNYDVIGRVGASFNRDINSLLTLPVTANGWFRAHAAATVFGGHMVNPTLESGVNASSRTTFLNVSGGKEIECSATIGQMNATGGIGAITLPDGASASKVFKYSFTPPIPKDGTKTFRMRFRMTCTRA